MKTLIALLCMLFLSAQSMALSHSHEGDLNPQPDCEICLKVSTDDDVVIDSANPVLEPSAAFEQQLTLSAWNTQAYFSSQPRAPPLV
jgi:hypothetical protein